MISKIKNQETFGETPTYIAVLKTENMKTASSLNVKFLVPVVWNIETT